MINITKLINSTNQVLSRTSKNANIIKQHLRQWRTSIINSFIPIEGDNDEYEINDDISNAKKEIIIEYLEDHKARKRRRINSSVIENRNKLLLCLNSETTFFMEPQPTRKD